MPDDQISGAVGCDTLSRLEEAPADLLAGSAGNEQCCGGERDDDLRSVKGDDWLAGDAGQPRRHTDFPLVADTIRRDDTVLVGLARGGLAAAAFAPDCRCRCR